MGRSPKERSEGIFVLCAILALMWGQQDLQGTRSSSAGKVSGPSSWPESSFSAATAPSPPACATLAVEGTRWTPASRTQGAPEAWVHAHRPPCLRPASRGPPVSLQYPSLLRVRTAWPRLQLDAGLSRAKAPAASPAGRKPKAGAGSLLAVPCPGPCLPRAGLCGQPLGHAEEGRTQ